MSLPVYVQLRSTGDEETEPSPKAHLHHRTRRRLIDSFTRPRLLAILLLLVLLPIYPLIHQPTHPPELIPDPNPYFSVGQIWEHNAQVAKNLERCYELGLLRNTSLPLSTKRRLGESMTEFDDATERTYYAVGCGRNQTTVVVLASLWFAEAFSGTSSTGEAIYAQSVISTLNAYQYSYVFSSLGWNNNDMRVTLELWNKHRWQIRTILADPEQAKVCWKDVGSPCRKSESNPDGIEPWRILSFWYWDDSGNPLGPSFTLSPSSRNTNHFLSYSIEPTCRRLPFIPAADRAHPPQAYLLSKQVHYLDDSPAFSWSLDALSELSLEFGIRVVAGVVNDDQTTHDAVDASGVVNIGQLDKIHFYEELARSFLLVGVGRPRISPSPWDALCMGLPFINPILTWDESDPLNRSKWHPQQWHMTDLEPPYVYSVHAHDLIGLRRAVQAALTHPIDSYIPPYMRFDYACDRMAEVVEMDWLGKAAGIRDERIRDGGEVRVFSAMGRDGIDRQVFDL